LYDQQHPPLPGPCPGDEPDRSGQPHRPTTPHRRAEGHTAVTAEDKKIMDDTLAELNPAAIQRQIQALTAELLTLTTSKAAARTKPAVHASSPPSAAPRSPSRPGRAVAS
jgi:hypothetical protein